MGSGDISVWQYFLQPSSVSSASYSMKHTKACRHCRHNKRKCVRRRPGDSCDICLSKRLSCESQLRSQSNSLKILLPKHSAVSHNTQDEGGLQRTIPDLPSHVAIEMVEHYLQRIHDKAHCIFHPNTLRMQVASALVPKALLYAICAMGSRFSASTATRAWESRLVTESKRLLLADLENVCLENIQTCILIATLCVGSSNSSETLFFRIAISMSEIMSLNTSTSSSSSLVAEIKRRVWWSLYIADGWCIAGLGMSSHMSNANVMIDPPMDEKDFSNLSLSEEVASHPWRPGMWAELAFLSRLFRPIHDLNRQIALQTVLPHQVDKEVEKLAMQLESWSHTLRDEDKMSMENLHHQQQTGSGGSFIALHLAYHYHAMMLYFRFLEDRSSKSSVYQLYVSRCKMHASSFSGLLRQSRQVKGCEVTYPLIGHMTTVCSSVLLHTLLFGPTEELPTVRRALESNFQALVELQHYWPATSAMINRLILFQEKCLLSTNQHTHLLNGWMLRFLLERSTDGDQGFPQNEATNDREMENLHFASTEFRSLGRFIDFEKA